MKMKLNYRGLCSKIENILLGLVLTNRTEFGRKNYGQIRYTQFIWY